MLKMTAPQTTVLSKADKTQKWVTLLAFLAPINALMVIDRIALIVATPILQTELHLTLVETTIVVSAVMWSYGSLQIPAGWCVTRFGPKIMMFGALFLWSTATILTPFAQAFYALIILRTIMGIGQSPDWPASVVTVRSWFGPTERAKGISILLAGQYLGAAIAAPLTTAIIVRTNWEVPFYIYGTGGLFLTGLWFFFFKERRETQSYRIAKPEQIQTRLIFRSLFRSRQFWALGCLYGSLGFVSCFIYYMLPNYLIHRRHVDFQTMGWLVGLPSLFLWISAVVTGPMADWLLRRTGSVWKARVPLGSLGCVIAGFGTGATDWVDGIGAMALCLCISFVGVGLVQVTVWSMAQDLTKGYTGILTGWTTTWGNLAAAGGPILIAFVVEATDSWKVGLALPLIVGFLGAVMVWACKPQCPIPDILPSEGS